VKAEKSSRVSHKSSGGALNPSYFPFCTPMMNAEQIKRQIQSLTDRLAALDAAPKRKRRRNKKKTGTAIVPGTTSTSVAIPMGTTGRRRRNRRGRVGASAVGQGEIRFSRCELLRSFTVPAGKMAANDWVDVIPDNFTLLKNISKSFERIRWNSIRFYWKPAVGTTFGGLVTMGADWDSDTAKTTRAEISAYTPSHSFAAWQDTQTSPLVLPSSRLQSRQWYEIHTGQVYDKQPCRVAWAADVSSQTADTMLGEVWVEYDAVLSGTVA
jgi:hypothetical protein